MEHELLERLDLIERMVEEGRATTERWGWSFVLWGVGTAAALVWSTLARTWIAWAVLMPLCAILTSVVMARRDRRRRTVTRLARTFQALWSAVGVALFIVGFVGGASGQFGWRSLLMTICVLLGVAYVASGGILRWPVQTALGALWWCAGISLLFVPEAAAFWIFLGTLLVAEVGFGLYLMTLERRRFDRA